MDTKSIKQVSSAKYLGITINEKLQWAEHISNITKRLVQHWVSYTEI